MTTLMAVLLAIFLGIMVVVAFLALRHRIMLKLGLRNIPRRPAQTVLIVVGSMLSAVIITASFATGDTISTSIRNAAIEGLGTVDEILSPARGAEDFGPVYVDASRFHRLQQELADFDEVDGITAYISESAPTLNLRSSLSEGQTRIVAPDPATLEGFGQFTLLSGQPYPLHNLPSGSALVNEEANDDLDAQVGDTLRLFLQDGFADLRVEGIVENGGLAGVDPTILMPLTAAQEVFDKPGQINTIAISNRGGNLSGVDLSHDVTTRLRVLFADPQIVQDLQSLLNNPEVLTLIENHEHELTAAHKEELAILRAELVRPEVTDELIRVLADEDVRAGVLDSLASGDVPHIEEEADTLFRSLSEMNVFEVKRFFLDLSDQAASGVTALFILLGLFSVGVGVLLVFLIFVMLAAARRTEMGMARAVGSRQSHLVQMFIFEGTAYNLVSAAAGVVVGIGVGYLIVLATNQILSGATEGFEFAFTFEIRSAIVAYCLGMIITFATVAVSAFRVSRMNIVEAVRGLPETVEASQEGSFTYRLLGILKSLVRPILFLISAVKHLIGRRFGGALRDLVFAALWLLILPWIADAAIAVLRFAWPYILRGWLTVLLGLILMLGGAGPWNQAAPFTIGSTMIIVGVGLMLRLAIRRWSSTVPLPGLLVLIGGATLLIYGIVTGSIVDILTAAVLVIIGVAMTLPSLSNRGPLRPEFIDRLTFTLMGVLTLALWILPFDTLEPVTGALDSNTEMFFISGVIMVAAAVWSLMYNADLLLKTLTFITAGIGKLRPVLVLAVAYPMSAKFRTGLTLAMFALVIFTLMVMSILSSAFSNTLADTDFVTGHWDVEMQVNLSNPIDDIETGLAGVTDLSPSDIDAAGGFVSFPVSARDPEAESPRWKYFSLQAVDDGYLRGTEYSFHSIAEGYGPTDEDVWKALRDDPSLAVIGYFAVEDSGQEEFGASAGAFKVESISVDDDTFAPIVVEVLETQTETSIDYTVIGVLELVADNSGSVIVNKQSIDEALPFVVPPTTYRFRTAPGVDAKETSRILESSFLEHGAEAVVLQEEIDEEVAINSAFNNLLTGFMGMGLIVGVAALGVISLRAVVERRQQVGMLRAIGYRQGMIQLSFLVEASFVSLLGVAIGVALGTILSFNLVEAFREQIPGLQFSMPWLQIGIIIGIAYLFAMITTYLPARQAGRIQPAEALRYE